MASTLDISKPHPLVDVFHHFFFQRRKAVVGHTRFHPCGVAQLLLLFAQIAEPSFWLRATEGLLLASSVVYSVFSEFQVFFVVFSPTTFSPLLLTGFAFLAIVSPRTFPHFGLRSTSTTFLLIGSGVCGFFT